MLHNYPDDDLLFLKEKIKDIRVALFRSEINSELQLPNNIVQTIKVEDDGTLWFFTSCTGDHAKSIARSFYAHLDFYKKGTGCRLQISGNATIVEDNNEDLLSLSSYSKEPTTKFVLVKMKIMKAEYFENKSTRTSWTNKFKAAFSHLFLPPSHRIYDFSQYAT